MEYAVAAGEGAAGQGGRMRWDFILNYEDNLNKLQTQIGDLKMAKTRVLNDVDAARNRLEEIEEDVESWLKSVDEEISKAEQILEDDQRASNCCCVSVKNRHKFSKKAKLESETIEDLMRRCQILFPRVGNPAPPPGLVPSRGYLSIESREGIVESILLKLKDGDVKVAGFWGLPGIGKTVLARKVEERARAEGYTVAFATVTHKPDLRKIQQEIADWLKFKFDSESTMARASELHSRLKLENKVLIILDDVWEPVGLDKIGIPSGGDTVVSKLPSGGDANLSEVPSVSSTNVCKVLLTSRDQRVLVEMEARAKDRFRLHALTEEAAWELFRANAGDVHDFAIPVIVTVDSNG